jgi:hypothetical protein
MGASDGERLGPGATIMSQCVTCRHRGRIDTDFPAVVCKAFPGGVPDDILANEVDRRKLYPNGQEDDEILYEPAEGADPANVRALLRYLDAHAE